VAAARRAGAEGVRGCAERAVVTAAQRGGAAHAVLSSRDAAMDGCWQGDRPGAWMERVCGGCRTIETLAAGAVHGRRPNRRCCCGCAQLPCCSSGSPCGRSPHPGASGAPTRARPPPAGPRPPTPGVVKSTKMTRTIVVRRDYLHYIKKYARCVQQQQQ
jgi:hypothetical protein